MKPGNIDRADLAWLAAAPAALLTVAAMAILGAPLGRAILPAPTTELWPSALAAVHPEATEQARYLIALGGALLVPLALFASVRWRLPQPSFARVGALLVQGALVAVLLLALMTQKEEVETGVVKLGTGYFTGPTIAVALLIALAFVACLSSPRALSQIRDLLALDSRPLRWGAAAVAALATVIWLLPAIQLDGTEAHGSSAHSNLIFTFDEAVAVLNGHSPLVDYVTQYGALWPYPVSIPMHLFDGSLGSFTASMAAITAVAMLAVFGVLVRVTRSVIAALALFLPFLATSFFLIEGTPINRYSMADYFGVFPMRYAGPYLVAYLISRQLSGSRPRLAFWIFLGAGLTVLNNTDFGIPALGAAVLALAAGAVGPRTRRWWLEFGGEALGGLLAAYAMVAILTLIRAGSLPDISLLFRYADLFALAGYLMLPAPWFGFWIVIYLTFAAALAVATLMLVRRSGERTMIGMLVWVGIFGLGIGSYYDGRSHPQVLVALFSAWSLALALLVVVAVRAAAAERRVGPAQVALFVGFGLAACSLAQFPSLSGSIDRLRSTTRVESVQPRAEARFVAAHTRPGEAVAVLSSLGQRMSREAHIDDVTPYTGSASMPTKEQLRETLSRLREAGGSTVILSNSEPPRAILPALEEEGFRVTAREPADGPEVEGLGDLVILVRRGPA